MYRLKCEQIGDNMVYQWYVYNPATESFDVCTSYNELTIINGVEYTPINGSFSISIDIMSDIPMMICQMHCELNDVRSDMRQMYKLIMDAKGWW